MTRVDFNVNNYVWVKLNDEGRRVFNSDQAKHPERYRLKLEEDGEGWSRWQLWELMRTFGHRMFNGCQVPFETTIRLELP